MNGTDVFAVVVEVKVSVSISTAYFISTNLGMENTLVVLENLNVLAYMYCVYVLCNL